MQIKNNSDGQLNTGGVERGVLDFNKYLDDKEHESYVISNGGKRVQNIIKDGGTHIHLQVSKSVFNYCKQKSLRTSLMKFHQISFT